MSTGYGSRGFEIAYHSNQKPSLSPFIRKVLATGRSAAIVLSRFYVRQTDGTADGMTANDSVGGGGARKVWGLTGKIMDTKGRELDVPYLGTTDAGRIQGWEQLDMLKFRGLEDGVSSAITSYESGSIGMVLGAVTDGPGSAQSRETFTPEPDGNDLLDSSTWSSTSTTNAFQLITADVDNRNDVDDAQNIIFQVGSTFRVTA